jgi:acyl carrier protein
MNTATLEEQVLAVFLQVAPDVDSTRLKRDVPFRDQFDFDSMDTLNFAIGLHKRFEIEVPETQYRELASLAKATSFVSAALGSREREPPSGLQETAERGGGAS